MRERLEEMLAEEPPEVVRGAGYQRMDEEMRAEYTQAREQLLQALGWIRYFALLKRLDELAAVPPWSEKASKPVDSVLRARVRHDYQRLAGRVELADEAEDPGEREHRLHEARKAAKRARYAAESLTGVYGKEAKRFVRAMKRVQSRLGDHHDAYVTQQRLRGLGDEAASTGDNSFVFGVLHAREERALLGDRRPVRPRVEQGIEEETAPLALQVAGPGPFVGAQDPPPPALRRRILGPASAVTSDPCAFSLTAASFGTPRSLDCLRSSASRILALRSSLPWLPLDLASSS